MWNIHDIARELRMSESGIYQWVSQKKIPVYRIGRSLRFDPNEIQTWLEKQKVKPEGIR